MNRILIVEDDADLAFGLQDDLQVEGYGVEIVRDGAAAVHRAREGAWDLILLDVMLPGKDGFEVGRELRRANLRTPIIILTARAHEAEKVMGLELGADDYVTKPFSPRELRARIKAVLRRTAPESPGVYSFGECEADFARGALRRGGASVEITAMELKLLAAFVRNRGRVLSRGQLLQAVWGNDIVVTDRVIDTHVANLRKKIEPQPGDPRYLVSVRGLGYRFDG